MIQGELIRIDSNTACTSGVLLINGNYVCRTLELPWLNNTPWKSCIPTGEYLCGRTRTPRFTETFEIMEVPGRTGILFHSGNKPRDTSGCVLVGKEVNSKLCWINDSRITRSVFMNTLLGVDMFNLKISLDTITKR